MRHMNWWLMPLIVTFLCIRTDQNVREKRQMLPDQPRILTQNGHLIFQSALNHNITFRSGSGGVFIDNLDLKIAANQAQTNKEAISRLQESQEEGTVHLLSSRLSHVEAQMTNVHGINDVQTQVSHLRTKVETLENLVLDGDGDDDDGGGGGRGIRQLQTRVQGMEDKVRNMQTLVTANECLSNPCHNGGTCVDMYNGYLCRCPPNWQGLQCSEDVDECAFYAGTGLGCQNGATCINSPGSFRCQCATNWYGIHCREQHNTCTAASHKELCGHGTCVSEDTILPGQVSYRCVCEAGWTQSSSDPACTADIDECANGTRCSVDPLVHCINIPGSFVCGSCPKGYTGNGHTCYDINECTINNGGCSTAPRVECINVQGSWTCGPCPEDYQGDGVSCRYVGACFENNGGCHNLATCSETSGYGIICSCRDGYLGSGEGPNGCQEQHHAFACASNPCDNGALCNPMGSTGFTCACQPRFAGPTCSVFVNACLSNPCQNGGTCVSETQDPGYSCQCTADYTSTNCEQQQQECGGQLSGLSGSFHYLGGTGVSYPHTMSCIWVISTSSDKILTVTFTAFSLEHNDCEFDFLQIYDGPTADSHMIGKYCRTEPPNAGTLNSTNNQLYVWFKSGVSTGNDEFDFHWISFTPTCGGHLNDSDHGTIYSPGYPGNYPSNRDCAWTLAVSPGSNIMFSFAHLALEQHQNCSYDYLEIRDGELDNAVLLRRFCTSETPVPIRTTGPYAYIRFHSDDILSDRGFHILYAALTDNRQGCGGALSGPEGEVMSPGFPQPYRHDIQCVWVITVAPGSSVQLTFSDFDLQTSSSCDTVYLKVKDGSHQTAPTLGMFCDTDTPAVVISSSNIIGIELHTDVSVTGRGFKAQWTTACGGTFSDLQGQIQSPHYPQSYPLTKMCDYLIEVPDSQIVRFELTDIELGESVDCTYNYVEFHDGANQAAAMIGSRLCSDASLSRIMSTGSQMFVRFSTDGSVNNRGFRGTFAAAVTGPEGCGGVQNANVGAIASPGYPSEYPNGVNCTWYINVSPGLVIRLIFHTFSFQNHPLTECLNDFVEIYDNSTMAPGGRLGRYCGPGVPQMVTSTDNVLVVYMQTDASIARGGFTAAYLAINTTTTCGADLTSATGVITSPNYPNPFPYNRQCVWTITAANNNQIFINITDLDIPHFGRCFFNFLEIRNGGYISSPVMQKYCGQSQTPPILLSHSNRLYLRFKSSFIYSGRGFRLEYTSAASGCGGDLTTPTGVIMSPNYPDHFTHIATCYWTITVSQGSVITLVFTDLDLLQYNGCQYDFLEVRDDGPSGASHGTFCGTTLPGPIRSQSNRLWLAYRTRVLVLSRRFRLQYHTDCNNRLSGISGVIESPNFPNPYAHQTNCTWVIEAPRGNRINVTFAAFTLESHPPCQGDYLQIRDGGDSRAGELAILCGSTVPDPFQSTSRHLWLNFVTDLSGAHEGFRLEWLVDGCGGHLSGSTGVITSPNYPDNPRQPGIECLWTITVDTGKRINLTISRFDYDDISGCRDPILKIIAGTNRNGIELTHLCTRLTLEEVLHTTGNTALVYFNYSLRGRSVGGAGFSLTYTAVSGGCGGNFTAKTATITSINYPQNYEPNTECEWSITLAAGHVVDLNFTDFDVQGLSCANTSVKLFDGPNQNAALIADLCGRSLSNNTAYSSTGNQMFIRMQTDAYTRKGFRATYTTGCGGIINADIDGEIFSPGYPGRALLNMRCVWNIRSSFNDRHVSLTFTYMDLNLFTYVSVGENYHSARYQMLLVRETGNSDSTLPATITSEGSALYVFFHSEQNSYGNGFRAVYSSAYAACGGEFTGQTGRFMSPNYPDGYPVNIECVWQIHSTPGSHVQISFSDFHLDPLGDINDDYVEIRSPNVSGAIVGRWIQDNTPGNATSLHGAWVKFRSNEDVTATGFVAEYSMSPGENLVGDSGQIASPQYPGYYPTNSNCRWTVLVSQGMRIRVTFSFFSLEQRIYNQICYNDYVAIYDGTLEDNVLLGRFCGSDLPGPLHSETNQITVTFRSDSWYDELGFLMNWLAVPQSGVPSVVPAPPGCGGQLVATDTLQNITSPGYPGNYPNDTDCFWTLSVPEGNTVVVNIISISLESDSDCFQDYLRFYDGETADDTVLTTYCHQTHNMGLIQSTANTMGIMFHTDSSGSGPGFVLKYEIGCGGVMQLSTGVIKSTGYPSYYPANQNCTWTVEVQPGKTISLDFEDQFNIADSGECDHDYLMLLNGFSPQSPPLFPNGSTNTNGRYCGSSKPQRMETFSNFLLANFVSDGSDQEIGFSLTYSSVSLSCGSELRLTDSVRSGYFMSPNYPEDYPHNVDCIWLIRAPASKRIQVDFEGIFHIEANVTTCNLDYVEFHDGGTTNAQRIGNPHCGTTLPGTVFSTGNFMLARFLTDSSVTHAGFKAKYSIATCGGRITAANGIISSPSYSANYGNTLGCEWTIAGPVGHFLSINITALRLQSLLDCTADMFQIRDGNSTGRVIFDNCGNGTLQSVETSDSMAYIRFRSGRTTPNSGFRLAFRVSVEECGGQWNTPTGVFTSPNYPGQYPHTRACTWDITVPLGRRVTLTFNDFRLEGPSSLFCEWDYVEVINGVLLDSPSLGRFCGETVPTEPVESSGNTMRVRFYTDGSVSNAGFQATYTSDREAECGGYITEPAGTISSPGFGNGTYDHSVQCVWRLNGDMGNSTIALRFTQINMQYQSSCIFDFVEIREGADINAPLVGKYCGNTRYQHYEGILIPGNQAWVRFKSDASVSHRGFSLLYAFNECGGVLTDPQGAITSPNSTSNNFMECAWKVVAPEGTRIKVNFTSLCSGYYINSLRLLNGGLPDSPVFEEFNRPGNARSYHLQSSAIRLLMRNIRFNRCDGFRMEYTAEAEGCGGLFHSNQGSFSSPNYPSSYPHNTECRWEIHVQAGYVVSLHFNPPFDLEARDCARDHVEVFNVLSHGALISLGRWCYNTEPPDLRSTSTKMVVVFQSDATTNGNGFSASWDVACGGVLTEQYGLISSPGYPQLYAANLSCDYIISPGTGSFIRLAFYDFELEGGHGCQNDYVRVWQGNASTDLAVSEGNRHLTHLGTFCGSSPPDHLFAQDQISVQFRTDGSGQYKGFRAHYYSQVCGGVYSEPSYPIHTPHRIGRYINIVNCSWNITVNPYRIIKLRFPHFKIAVSPQCQDDHVTIYDGPDTDSPSLGRYCGDEQNVPGAITSTGNQMYITLSASADTSIGFYGYYQSNFGPAVGCGGVLRQSSGTITSVDIDNDGRYEDQMECEWLIFVNENKVVTLTVTNLDLQQPSYGYCNDKLTIYDGLTTDNPVIAELCGNSTPSYPILASSNVVLVVFRTDWSENAAGFNATFGEIDAICGGAYNATNTPQTLSSPNYPNSTGTAVRCVWIIDSGDATQHVRLHVTDLQLQTTQRCVSEQLTFRDQPMGWHGQEHAYCGNIIPHPFKSIGAQVKIIYHLTTTSHSRGFQLTYQIADCNENISQPSGLISNQRNNNPNNCTTIVTSPANTTLALYFYMIYTGEGNDQCERKYLEIRNSSSAIVARSCSRSMPLPIFLTDNVATIRCVTENVNQSCRYDITFISSTQGPGCGGSLTGLRSGTFTNPGYPGNYPEPMTCIWYITPPAAHRLEYGFYFSNTPRASADCDSNYVSVYSGFSDTDPLLGRFCGENAFFRGSDVPIMVRYHSSGNSSAPIFQFYFHINMNMYQSPGY